MSRSSRSSRVGRVGRQVARPEVAARARCRRAASWQRTPVLVVVSHRRPPPRTSWWSTYSMPRLGQPRAQAVAVEAQLAVLEGGAAGGLLVDTGLRRGRAPGRRRRAAPPSRRRRRPPPRRPGRTVCPPSTMGTLTAPAVAFTVPCALTAARPDREAHLAQLGDVAHPAAPVTTPRTPRRCRAVANSSPNSPSVRRRVGRHHEDVTGPALLDGDVDHQVVARPAQHRHRGAADPGARPGGPQLGAEVADPAHRLVHGRHAVLAEGVGVADVRARRIGHHDGPHARAAVRRRERNWSCMTVLLVWEREGVERGRGVGRRVIWRRNVVRDRR